MWDKNKIERYALTVISRFYPEYTNMKKREHPDFENKNKSIGIEITNALTKQAGKCDAFWSSNQGKKYCCLSRDLLQSMGYFTDPTPLNKEGIVFRQHSQTSGALYYYRKKDTNDLVLFLYISKSKTNEETKNDIVRAVLKKLKKLNTNYDLFRRNDLCVFIQEQISYDKYADEIVNSLKESIIAEIKLTYKTTPFSKCFDNVFLLFWDNLFCVNTKTWEWERKVITEEDRQTIISQCIE